jgi:HD-GYP domain-containing protein (c-di-GMP phosphodiesterase class II)
MDEKRGTLFLAIPKYAMRPGVKTEFNIYVKKISFFNLVVPKGEAYPENLNRLLQNSYDSNGWLYIKSTDKHLYYDHIEKYLHQISNDATVPLKEKANLVHMSASGLVEDLFEKPDSKETIDRAKNLVDETFNVIMNNEASVKTLMSIGSHDYYTYTHSVDVSIYAIGFAKFLGFLDEEIKAIGYAGMMHDIGKSKIPREIINKKGKLDGEEFEMMKRHPVYSYNILNYHGETNENILMGVRSHHEKSKGNGYPDGLKRHQIHDYAKIITLSDIFSALTTDRSYKEAFTSFKALELMKTTMLEDLDKAMFYDFIRFIANCSLQE